MSQKATHTWDLVYHYHRCQKCGRIIESRENYQYQLGRYLKELKCPYCSCFFTIVKPRRSSFAPFFGEGAQAEIEW